MEYLMGRLFHPDGHQLYLGPEEFKITDKAIIELKVLFIQHLTLQIFKNYMHTAINSHLQTI